jgi:hypothetical protein
VVVEIFIILLAVFFLLQLLGKELNLLNLLLLLSCLVIGGALDLRKGAFGELMWSSDVVSGRLPVKLLKFYLVFFKLGWSFHGFIMYTQGSLTLRNCIDFFVEFVQHGQDLSVKHVLDILLIFAIFDKFADILPYFCP